MIAFTVYRIVGYVSANFIWQLVTGRHDWGFAITVSFFQAWAIAWTVRDTRRLIQREGQQQ